MVDPSSDRSGSGVAEPPSPFQGLGFYTEADARWFFGRVAERKIILAHLRTARLTLLYAESGVGESSLLRAGVAARLHELAARGVAGGRSSRFVPIVFSAWKDDPVQDLIGESERRAGAPAANDEPPTGLANAIRAASSALDATLVIILDQFEEHFSYRLEASHPDRLADELAECVTSPDVPANFLIAVREDAYGRLGDLFSGRIGNVYNNYLHLEYMTREAARDAIEKPVEIYNSEHDRDQAVVLEDDLADAVLDEVRRGKLGLGAGRLIQNGDGGSLGSDADKIETPFLQLVMTRLWDSEREHGSRVLRKATLESELGGAESIVRDHVSRALAGLAGAELETATDIFANLVTPSGVKVAHTAGDLARMTAHSPETVAAVLDGLYEERILRAVDPAPGSTEARYEIFHDRLADPILDWRDQRENARLKRATEQAEREAESQRAQARLFKRRSRIMLVLAVGLLILLAAVVVLLQYARDKSTTASRERRQATYFGLTSRAQSQLSSRPDVSLLLDLAAYGESPQPLAARNLAATLQAARRSGAVGILHGHTDAVESIAFSPGGGTLASVSGDKTLRFWSVTRSGRYPLGHPLHASGPLYSVAWDPSGRTVASGSFNDVILWSVARHAQEQAIRYDSGAVTTVAFSRHGERLAAGGFNGTVLLWNVVTHKRTLLRLPGRKPVTSVAFSRDGTELATGSDKSVVLWKVANASPVGQPLTGVTGDVYTVAFSPDGKTIAAAGSSGQVVRWNVATGRPFGSPLTGLSKVYDIAFSPDGRALAAGGARTTMLWQLASNRRLGEALSVRQGAVNSVAFSPDGRVLASAGADRTITVWNYPVGPQYGVPLIRNTDGKIAISPDGTTLAAGSYGGQIYLRSLRTGRLRRLPDEGDRAVSSVAFDPARPILAAAYHNGMIRLWNYASPHPSGAPLASDTAAMYSVAFDHRGTTLVSGGSDGTVRLWDVRTETQRGRRLRGGPGAVYAVAFDSDGREVASGGADRTIRFWSARMQAPLDRALIAQNNAVFALAFSPGGRWLASGGADDTVHLWDARARGYGSVHTLAGDTNLIRAVAFSPDGRTLASGSTDTTVRVWDVASGTELGNPLLGHKGSVESVAFTPDGKLLASGSIDGTVRLWQAVDVPPSSASLRDQVCSFVGAGLSRVEWAQYAPDIPYHQSCPRTTPS
jgi:WD40 repeat protein